GFYDIARAGFAFGADHSRALTDAPQCLAQVARSTHERHREKVLIDMEMLISRRQHLRLVDAIHANGLQDLSFNKVTDTALGHDRNSDGLFNRNKSLWTAQARHATMNTNVGRHALQGHNRASSRLFGDARLLGIHNITDNSALEHLGEDPFDLYRSCLLLHG